VNKQNGYQKNGKQEMSEWKECKLGDIANNFAMGPFGSNIKAENFVDEGIPVIRGKNLNYSKYVDGEFVYLSEVKAVQLKSSNCFPGDLVFTHRGTLGQVALIPEGKYSKYVVSQSGMKLSVKKDILDNHFLFYFFKSDIGKHELLQHEAQVGVPSISNPLTSLKSVNISLPPLPEQRAIAGVLSSLDDKIDLLHRQNKTLEGMAEALWRKMFVEEADPAWKKGKLGDEIIITMGQSPPGNTYNEEELGTVFFQGRAEFGFRFPQIRLYTTEPKRFSQKGDTLVSVRAPVGDINMAFEDCCIGRGLAAVRHTKGFTSYTFYKIRSLKDDFDSFEQQGTVFGAIGKDDFNNIETIIPDENVVQQFDILARPLDDKFFTNSVQIRTLSHLRDTLLPKLMSGEVRMRL
jgi:type I restriction enzyme, S subunit